MIGLAPAAAGVGLAAAAAVKAAPTPVPDRSAIHTQGTAGRLRTTALVLHPTAAARVRRRARTAIQRLATSIGGLTAGRTEIAAGLCHAGAGATLVRTTCPAGLAVLAGPAVQGSAAPVRYSSTIGSQLRAALGRARALVARAGLRRWTPAAVHRVSAAVIDRPARGPRLLARQRAATALVRLAAPSALLVVGARAAIERCIALVGDVSARRSQLSTGLGNAIVDTALVHAAAAALLPLLTFAARYHAPARVRRGAAARVELSARLGNATAGFGRLDDVVRGDLIDSCLVSGRRFLDGSVFLGSRAGLARFASAAGARHCHDPRDGGNPNPPQAPVRPTMSRRTEVHARDHT